MAIQYKAQPGSFYASASAINTVVPILSNDNTAQSGTWTWTTNSANTGATISTYKPDPRAMTLLGVG